MLAQAAGISSFHFHRLFLQETGLTPQKYVEKLRLEHAAHMMALNPETSMIQLAFESGFSSPSSFSRSFQHFFGLSPSKYRKNQPNPTLQAVELERSQAFSLSHDLHIQYLPNLFICAHLISLEAHKIEEFIVSDFQIQAPLSLIGVFLDAPIHLAPEACRYLLGTSCNPNDSNFQVEAGYYVKLIEKGSLGRLRTRVIELHKYLTQHNYRIREPIAFEKMKLAPGSFSYSKIERELFIPISRI